MQALSQIIGLKADLGRGLDHPFPGVGAQRSIIVQRLGNRADRHLGELGHIANCGAAAAGRSGGLFAHLTAPDNRPDT